MSTETVPVTSNPLDAVKHAAGSDIGLRREENQDSYGIIQTAGFKLFIVADGMGGVKGGGIASNLAINVLKECLEEKTDLSQGAITAAVEHANSEIFEKGTGDPALAGMGTTYVGLGFVGSKMLISSVGDSRAYRVRDNHIQQLTIDHTLVMELLRSGAISAEQADNHPVSHMLTRSLGPAPTVEVDCWVCADGPARGDIYIMCSDGLYNLVHDHEIAQIVQDNYIDVAVQKLIKLANERGGTDNVTVIVVEISEDFPVGPEAFEQAPAAAADAAETDAESDSVSAEEVPAESEQAASDADDNTVSDEDVTPISMTNGKHEAAPSAPSTNGKEKTDALTSKPNPKTFEKKSPKLQSKVDPVAAKVKQDKLQSEKLNVPPQEGEVDPQAAPASEEQQATDKAAPERRISRTLLLGGACFLTMISFVGGFFGSRFMAGSNNSAQRDEVLAPVQQQAQIARLEAEVGRDEGPHKSMAPALRLGFSELSPSAPSERHVDEHDSHDGGLSNEDNGRIQRRKDVLRELLSDLQEKIGAFEKPLNAKVIDQLKDARQNREQLESSEDDLRAQIDVATRRLAVWYGRRKRLQSTDPINLATEVAVASATVKDKKEVFELATWSYLKEAEVLRYNPSDGAQEKKVFDLARIRKDRQRELGDEVRRAIEKEVSESDRAIAELTLKRDKLLVEIENIRRNEEYAKVLMGSDPKAKDAKRKELSRERDVAAAELEELNHMSPDAVQRAADQSSDSAALGDPASEAPTDQGGNEVAH